MNSLLKELNNKLLLKDTKIQDLSELIGDKEKLIGAQTAHLEEVENELGELKPQDEEKSFYPYETRIICPMCQAVGKNIREVEDRSKKIRNGPIPMYAKKYICKSCGYNWNKL